MTWDDLKIAVYIAVIAFACAMVIIAKWRERNAPETKCTALLWGKETRYGRHQIHFNVVFLLDNNEFRTFEVLSAKDYPLPGTKGELHFKGSKLLRFAPFPAGEGGNL